MGEANRAKLPFLFLICPQHGGHPASITAFLGVYHHIDRSYFYGLQLFASKWMTGGYSHSSQQ